MLVADDDPISRLALTRSLEKLGHQVAAAQDGSEAFRMMTDDIQVALLDVHMPKTNGLECLKRIGEEYPDTQVIMVTSSEDISDAVEAMKRGAVEYVTKPIDTERLVALVQKGCDAFLLSKEHRGLSAVVGQSLPTAEFSSAAPSSRRLKKQIDRVARLDSTILITGESGTGKTTVARMIHRMGKRANGPFVAVNCASLPRDLIEAELFGHAKGAFTGAVGERPGHIEIANGGTLFLDEIGDMPLDLQPKLLTFLQDRIIRRIGCSRELSVDVRLIAATHQDLHKMCSEKQFRQDLFYRLNVLDIEIPPIRQRRDDIPALATSILQRIALRRDLPSLQIDEDVMNELVNYHWPGNIRELENVLERASAFAENERITIDDVRLPKTTTDSAPDRGSEKAQSSLLGKTLEEVEILALRETLAACGGNKAKTARELGISEKSVYNKVKRYGLEN